MSQRILVIVERIKMCGDCRNGLCRMVSIVQLTVSACRYIGYLCQVEDRFWPVEGKDAQVRLA